MRPVPEAVIAPPTESRRWPETPSSVRQPPLGGLCLRRPLRSNGVGGLCSRRPLRTRTRVPERPASAEFVCADSFAPACGYPNDRRRQILYAPTASVKTTGVGNLAGTAGDAVELSLVANGVPHSAGHLSNQAENCAVNRPAVRRRYERGISKVSDCAEFATEKRSEECTDYHELGQPCRLAPFTDQEVPHRASHAVILPALFSAEFRVFSPVTPSQSVQRSRHRWSRDRRERRRVLHQGAVSRYGIEVWSSRRRLPRPAARSS
jgi:hypothetical protein